MAAAVTAEQAEKPYVFRGPLVRRLSAEQFADTVSMVTGEWRLLEKGKTASPARDWQFKASPLALALGRPIRDQVFTTRDNRPTTFQALELANGTSLEHMLQRGALRLLGKLPPAPDNLFDSGVVRKGSVPFDIDISGLKQLWLLEEDAGSYDRTRTIAGWTKVELSGPSGSRVVSGVSPMPVGSQKVIPIAGAGYTRMRGTVALDDRSLPNEIGGSVRFFVFGAEPDEERLLHVVGQPPRPLAPDSCQRRRGGSAIVSATACT